VALGLPEHLLRNVTHQGRDVAAHFWAKYAQPQCTQRQTKAKKKSSGKPQKTQEIENPPVLRAIRLKDT
jgi:hypothetical protein